MPSVVEARAALETARDRLEQDPESSVAAFERATVLASRAGSAELEADAELGLGEALYSMDGRETESLYHFHRAAELGAGTTVEALAWLTAGNAMQFLRNVDGALVAYEHAAQLFLRLNDVTGESLARSSRGSFLLALKRPDEAIPDLQRAAQLFWEDNEPGQAAQMALAAGEALLYLHQEDAATRALTTATEIFQALGEKRLEARARSGLLVLGDSSQLLRMNELLAEHAAEEGDSELEARARLMQARLLSEMQ